MPWRGIPPPEAMMAAVQSISLYEDVLVPRLFLPLAEQLLDLVDVQPGERVLDIACGPGTVAQLAAARVGLAGHVTGCDVSPAMLDVARSKSSSIEWLETSAAPLVGVAEESFDVVTCQQGLQFFPDRPAAVAEMHRALVPGGRVAIAVWGPLEHSPAFAALAAALREVKGDESADRFRNGPWGMPDPDALAELLGDAGFVDVQVVPRTVSGDFEGGPEQLVAVLAISPVADDVAVLSDEAAVALPAALARHAEPLTEDGVIRSTLEANVAFGRKP